MLTEPFCRQYAKAVGGDVAEVGAGPGSYNIHKSVWHVNCCSPTYNIDSGWGIFNARMYRILPILYLQQLVHNNGPQQWPTTTGID